MANKNDLPNAVIYDFDGTFCDVRSILPLLDRSDPHLSAFHEATVNAPENKKVFELLEQTQEAGITGILISVRGERWRGVTTEWLGVRDYEPEHFHMRRDDDTRPHAEIKREIVVEIKKKFNVLAAVDDDPKNHVMFDEENIPSILVPGYNGIDDPNSLVVPEWWETHVINAGSGAHPASLPSLRVPQRMQSSLPGNLCHQPVKSANNAPCILRAPHRGNCRSKV